MTNSMNISKLAVAAFISTLATRTNGFSVSSSMTANRSRGILHMSSKADEIAALRAAAQKARDEAQRLSKELGKDIDFTTGKPVADKAPVKALSSSDVLSLLSSNTKFETDDAVSQVNSLDSLVSSGDLSMWKSAQRGPVGTQSPAPLRTFPVSIKTLESRSGGKLSGKTLGVEGDVDVSLDDIKDATIAVTLGATALGIASLAFLPQNIGATLCYLFALIPIVFLGIGSTSPGLIADGIAIFKGTADDEVKKEDRVVRHEAGHFLCGYLCGLPVKSYSITDLGYPCVEFHPTSAGASSGRELSAEEIASLSVIALSGSVAEVLSFENAKGGENDFLELQNIFRRSKDFIGSEKQQDLTRWGALTAYNLINGNKDRYEKLVEAFKQKKSVAECVAAVEASL
uniref:Peptidase M41 domain-containing protein n=1 Tax=Eucampia antarctica TaxID=49252 RepID=A0A7S2RM93_9STRA|mmetsp:Transcript_23682/g.22711  ORF Transcript_23682/g.22711 Transcript_23682/m.22711 type:complete len:401 (+) Transcript_23682:69-1271(+)|eukprot:CAMPEP_0197838014 /NCGR_PEP_ID=MMETSP1437-20131217/33976_1 /TAXON_ID=49252 ORGANISM="Eucampia antarctica, Strain CCMP1452" /NCGR_SAMPLE_ID=MMETSP1437 /ASSEMBLY_ACC=CAM_ASM_001096 /LENGTH=400 /DNA_ID=CAMNT_0043445517 /DNA_START=69 /DNA_END=1271 /DNA_ORIENTATION=+